MELQEIKTFVTVAEHESFSKAAKYLEYSQAAVTIQIKNIEEELSVKLFDRLGKTIRLTSSGKKFYEHAVRILNDVQEMKESVIESETLTGTLSIGTIDSLCSSVFPGIIDKYHESSPKVSLSVTTDTPGTLLNMLKNNELDVVYLFDEMVNDPVLISVMVKEERIVFTAAENHPLADGRKHRMEELIEYPFILTEKDASYRKVLDTMLLKNQKQIIPVFQSNNTDLLLNQVKKQMGIAFLPYYVIENDEKQGVLKEIRVKDYNISVWRQVLYHKDKWVNREMKKFFEVLEELR
ncbi:MAG: LysR family transcriptional regulator [Thermoflexaceae bacterium]|nr:LysR family transcriptional regulator [Thermoflexaceae bacterium]